MDKQLAAAKTLRYAQELRQLHSQERAQRRLAEDALARLHGSYTTTVRALAAALELRDDQTGDHAERVTALALRLAREVAPELALDEELEYARGAGSQFDSAVADAFLALAPELRRAA